MNPIKTAKLISQNELNIFYTNIQSINRHYDELQVLLGKTSIKYDVIALLETWISEDQLPFFCMAGYNAMLQSRVDGRRSGGVIIYVKTDLQIITKDKIILNSGNALKIKIRTHQGDRKANNRDVSIVLVYRDCRSSMIEFVKELEEKIINLNEENEVIIGDMNINILNEEISGSYLNTLVINGYESLQNQPSQDVNCLDHVMMKGTQIKAKVEKEKTQISDHAAFTVEIESLENKIVKNTNENITLKFTDEDKLRVMLHEYNWTDNICEKPSENLLKSCPKPSQNLLKSCSEIPSKNMFNQ